MLVQIGKYYVNLGAVSYIVHLTDEHGQEVAQFHFINSSECLLLDAEHTRNFHTALAGLRFAAPAVHGNGMH